MKKMRINFEFILVVFTKGVFSFILQPYANQDIRCESMPSMSALNVSENLSTTTEEPAKFIPFHQKLCLTEGCVMAAAHVLKDMDKSIDPCEDFYQFTCGKFQTKFIPDDKTGISTFSETGDKLQEQLRFIVEEEIKPNESRPLRNAKNLYKLCMNETRIEELGAEPVKKIQEELGGWPVVVGNNWDMGSFTWKNAIYKFRKIGFGVDYFIDFGIGADVKNTTTRIIEFDQAAIGMNREYMIKGLEHPRVKAYYEYMVDIAVLFGAERSKAEKELMESLEFEISLANISLPLEQRRDPNELYNKMSLAEMQRKFPTIPWKEYLTNILPSKIHIGEDEMINVAVPSFVTGLERLLEQTPKRVQANYVMWRGTAATISYLPDVFRKRQLKYITAITGSTKREDRWKECADLASRSVSLAVGSLYVQKYFNKNAKTKALELVLRIREEMYKILDTVDWMDDVTRKAAIEKAHSMVSHIAYPDELLDQEKLITFYEGLEINDNGNYLDAILNTTRFGQNYSYGRLRDPINKTEWISHGRPAVINAFYSPLENSIQFPAGILQGGFFSEDRPSYMNFGAIGYVIGHEITHGFDDQGRQFDKEGTLADWWAPETKEKYLKKARCIIEQYGNYTHPQVNLNLNGINTQGENIADNGGIKQAYRAYLAWVKDNGEEARLPGLQQFSPKQMFWISAGSTWCSIYRDETLSNRIITGVHSPSEFRVRGPLSNMEDFARDFNCPKGSSMNPVHKCTVW